MGVDYEEYFGCDETGESVEDALDREMLLAEDKGLDIDRIEEEDEDMEWMEEGEDEEAIFDEFREQFSRIFDLAHIRERDLNIMIESLNAILRGFPPDYTMSYKESEEEDAPTHQFETADVYELMRLCFTNEHIAMRTKAYMQAIADHLNAKKSKPLIPDEEIPF